MAKDYSGRIRTNKNEVLVRGNGKLMIYTDSAIVDDGVVSTDIEGKTFEISGTDVLRLQALLAEKKVTCVHSDGFFNKLTYVIVGENAECKEAVELYIELNKRIEEFNKSRHGWERKLKL